MNIERLAEGAGARCVVITEPGQLENLDLVAMAGQKPLVLDIRIDPTVPQPVPPRVHEEAATFEPNSRTPRSGWHSPCPRKSFVGKPLINGVTES